MFRAGNSLLIKVGLIMMTLALALVIGAVVVSVTLGSEAGRVASFAEGRIAYREWARRSGRLADIHSIDDCLDHDVDELMV